MNKVDEAIVKINARFDAATDDQMKKAGEGSIGVLLGDGNSLLYVGLPVTSQEGDYLSDLALEHFAAIIADGRVPFEMAFKGAIEHALVTGCMIGLGDDG